MLELIMESTTPLLMKNIQLADPMNPIVKAIDAITSKKKNMTEADHQEVERLKFVGGLYYDQKVGPYIPAPNLFKCAIEAARKTREGKAIEGGIVWPEDKAILEYEGPRGLDALWADGRFTDRRMVAINRARVPGVRPIFPEWSARIGLDFDPEVIDFDRVEAIFSLAGRAVGVGDFRRFYGRFTATIKQV